MKIKQFKVKKSQVINWREVFQNPRPIIVESFITGTVNINRLGTLNPEHPEASDVVDEVLNVPIMAHHVHHEKMGDYLLDAGLDSSYTDDPFGGIKAEFADEFNQEKNKNIKYQIDKRNITLIGVFLSHLHSDHIAGVRELPQDIPYILGKGQIDHYQPEVYGDFLKDLVTLYEIDFSKLEDMPPLGPSADLLGDGSLWAVLTPGHTKGHISFIINGFEGPILLTMDACFIKDNLKFKVAPSDYTEDVELAQKSLDIIIDFLEWYPVVRVICGHECII